ncbi:MAG: protease complex subunit PrcB family protein [Patescibacteria group bacterium]
MLYRVLLTIFGLISAALITAAIVFGLNYSQDEEARSAQPSPTPLEQEADMPVEDSFDRQDPSDGGSTIGKTPQDETSMPTELDDEQYRVLAQNEGDGSGLETAQTQVIFSQEELNTIWDQIYANVPSTPPQPEVNVNEQAVILYAMGQQPSGGYQVVVHSVEETADQVLVTFKELVPGEGCFTTQQITYPFILISYPNTGKQFVTNVQEEVQSCQ